MTQDIGPRPTVTSGIVQALSGKHAHNQFALDAITRQIRAHLRGARLAIAECDTQIHRTYMEGMAQGLDDALAVIERVTGVGNEC